MSRKLERFCLILRSPFTEKCDFSLSRLAFQSLWFWLDDSWFCLILSDIIRPLPTDHILKLWSLLVYAFFCRFMLSFVRISVSLTKNLRKILQTGLGPSAAPKHLLNYSSGGVFVLSCLHIPTGTWKVHDWQGGMWSTRANRTITGLWQTHRLGVTNPLPSC